MVKRKKLIKYNTHIQLTRRNWEIDVDWENDV